MNINNPTKESAIKVLLDQRASGDLFLQAAAYLAQHSAITHTIDVTCRANQSCDIGDAVTGLSGVGILLHKLRCEPKKGLIKSILEKVQRRHTVKSKLPQTFYILRRDHDWILPCITSLDLLQFLIDYGSENKELFAPATLHAPCGEDKFYVTISLLHIMSLDEQRLTIYFDLVSKTVNKSIKPHQVTRVSFCGKDLFRRVSA